MRGVEPSPKRPALWGAVFLYCSAYLTMHALTAHLPSLSLPSLLRRGSFGIGREPPGVSNASPARPDVDLIETVDVLLAGAAFDPEAAYDRYWIGDYNRHDVRTSLFGGLEGRALEVAVCQLLNTGQRRLQDKPGALKAFNALFMPLLDVALAEAGQAGAAPVVSAPAPLDARRIVDALYQGQHQGDPEQALTWFGARKGEALWAALDEVASAMDDPALNISGEDRQRVRTEISAIRQHVLMTEAGALPEDGPPTSLALRARPDSAPMTAAQARRVVHALLDHRPGDDAGKVWALFEGRKGLDLLRALDEVRRALYDEGLKDLIDPVHRQRIDACIQDMCQSVHVEDHDRLVADLLRSADPEALHEGSPSPTGAPPLDAWGVINQLSKGKYADADVATIELFDGRTGTELEAALDAIEEVLLEDARLGDAARLPAHEREDVLACIGSFRKRLLLSIRASDDSIDGLIAQVELLFGPAEGTKAPTPSVPPEEDASTVLNRLIAEVQTRKQYPGALTKCRSFFDPSANVFLGALELGGMDALKRLLVHFGPLQQWQVLSTLVENEKLQDRFPGLLALEADVHRHYVATRRGNQPLEAVRTWYRLLSAQPRVLPAPPAVPEGLEPVAWIRMLRIMLYQRHPEPSRQRHELSRALARYQQALGVEKADREHGEALWLDPVRPALAASPSGHALLDALRKRLGSDPQVAQALMSTLAEVKAFGDDEQAVIYRAAAILMAEHDHCLPCIATPYLEGNRPRILNILYPKEPKPGDPPAAWDRYRELAALWTIHAPLVDHDLRLVKAWLTAAPTTKFDPKGGGLVELTVGEQCDRLLCAMELPPKRVELALLKIALSIKDPDDRELYLLVRRLLSELRYSERNDGGRNSPMSALDILLRLLCVPLNGLREGAAHGAALFGVRVAAYCIGPWALPAMGLISCGLSLWAWHHLEHAKSPDYLLNPSPVLDTLIQLVPTVNTVALSGLLMCTGILPVMHDITVPLDVGEALYVMNIMRLLRQVMQSGTQPFARLFRLTDARGAGLPAQLTFFVNCGRDALYVISSTSFLVRFADYLNDLMAQWGPPRSAAEVLLYLFLKTLPSTLNETADGMNPDVAILVARLLSWLKGVLGLGEDELMLQPGVPMQWAGVPRHMADHIAGRSNIVGMQDAVFTASALAAHLGHPGLTHLFRWLGTLLNGFLGSLRGRELGYMRTTDPAASAVAPHDGFNPRNPDGLLVAMGYAASAMGSRVLRPCQPRQSGTGPLRTAVMLPPQVRERVRERANTLVQSSRGRGTPPDGGPPWDSNDNSTAEEGSQELVDLSDGTPRLQRHRFGSPADDDGER